MIFEWTAPCRIANPLTDQDRANLILPITREMRSIQRKLRAMTGKK